MRGLSVAVAAASVLAACGSVVSTARSAFPGSNGEIAYSIALPNSVEGIGRGSDPRSFRIDVCGLDWQSGTRRRLTPSDRHSATWYTDPAWPATGDQLLVSVPGPYGTSVAMFGASGAASRSSVDRASSPAWHPDGKQIAFVTAGGAIGLGTLGGPQRILRAGPAGSPAWSPDGSRLAFVDSGQLAVMNADGTGFARLTADTALYSSPNWSPDGSRLVFVAQDAEPVIEVMNADGTGRSALLSVRSFSAAPGSSYVDPTWSPDGTRIAFVQWQDDRDATDVYVMDADGSNVSNLTRSPFDEFGIDWRSLGPAGSPPPADATCGVSGTPRADRLSGSGDFDVVYALGGSDTISVGADDDIVAAADGADTAHLGAGNDLALGGAGADLLDGGDGRDELIGGTGDDRLLGGRGDDFLGWDPPSESGDDDMDGGTGDDELNGGAGRDRLTGGRGADLIIGGAGDDLILVRDGATDIVRCGPGRDVVRADRRDRVHLAGCERILRR